MLVNVPSFHIKPCYKRCYKRDIGCGAVDSPAASHTRGPRLKSSHRQLLLNHYLMIAVHIKGKQKERNTGNGPLKTTLQ